MLNRLSPHQRLVSVALVLSALFSLWIIYSKPVLNDDAWIYLKAAEVFSSEGLGAVLDQYGWYTYSVVIAVLDMIVPGDIIASAWFFNILCYLLLTWAFISISREFDPTPAAGVIAALIILAFPLLNEMRNFLMRDAAYWALSLTALLRLLQYNRQRLRMDAMLWAICSILAVVFRLEALLPMFLAPFALLRAKDRQWGRQAFLNLYGILLALVAGILLLTLLAGINLLELMQFAWRYYLPSLYNIVPLLLDSARAVNRVVVFEDNFTNYDGMIHGVLLMSIANCYAVLVNLAAALSMPATVVLLFAWIGRKLKPEPDTRSIYLIYLVTAFLSLLTFQFIMHFQTQRYAALMSLLLLLLLPGYISTLWTNARQTGKVTQLKWLLGLACVYFFTDSLVSFGHSKRYVVDAGHWVAVNLPADAVLLTNVKQVAYESSLVADYDKIERNPAVALNQWRNAQYVAIEIRKGQEEQLQFIASTQLELLQSFANTRGDAIYIFGNKQPVQSDR